LVNVGWIQMISILLLVLCLQRLRVVVIFKDGFISADGITVFMVAGWRLSPVNLVLYFNICFWRLPAPSCSKYSTVGLFGQFTVLVEQGRCERAGSGWVLECYNNDG
jgi:hypothetical protein